MGLLSHIKTTPMSFPEVSHSTIIVFVKFIEAKTGSQHISSLRCSKAFITYGVQQNVSFLNNGVRGSTIFPQLFKKCNNIVSTEGILEDGLRLWGSSIP